MNDNKLSVMDQARSWYVRLSMAESDEVASLEAGLQEWLEQSQAHRDAYANVASLHLDAETLKTSRVHGRETAAQRLQAEPVPWLRYGAVAAAIVAVVMIVTTYRSSPSPAQKAPEPVAHYEPFETVRGEIRQFRLADGSVATLDTDSRIEVSMTKKARHLRLSQGRARLSDDTGKSIIASRVLPGSIMTGRPEGTLRAAACAQPAVSATAIWTL